MKTAMTSDERADPRGMSYSRRVELAAAANLTEEELSAVLCGYDVARTHSHGREILWWQDVLLQSSVWLMFPFLVLVAAGRFVVQKMRSHRNAG